MEQSETQSPGSLERMVSQPRRIQLMRKKGWKLPANTVAVARPRKWGNPFKVGAPFTQAQAVEQFQLWCVRHNVEAIRADLRGKNLACWCRLGTPCHADVLLRLANEKS